MSNDVRKWAQLCWEDEDPASRTYWMPALNQAGLHVRGAVLVWPAAKPELGDKTRDAPAALVAALATPTTHRVALSDLAAGLAGADDRFCFFFGQPYQRRLILPVISEAPQQVAPLRLADAEVDYHEGTGHALVIRGEGWTLVVSPFCRPLYPVYRFPPEVSEASADLSQPAPEAETCDPAEQVAPL